MELRTFLKSPETPKNNRKDKRRLTPLSVYSSQEKAEPEI
jgi:hypothetical protein